MKKIGLVVVLLLLMSGLTKAYDRAHLMGLVRLSLNEASTETDKSWSDVEIYNHINDAISLIEGVALANQAETTYTVAAGTYNYILPGDFWISEGVWIAKDVASTSSLWKEPRALRRKQIQDVGLWDNSVPDRTEIYSIWGDSIMFWPNGGAAKAHLRYYARSDTTNFATTTTTLNRPYEALISSYALAKCWEKFSDARAAASMQFFLSTLQTLATHERNSMKSQFPVSSDTEPQVVTPTDTQ